MLSIKILVRSLLITLIFILSVQYCYADHLKGGWIKYTYLGESSGKVSYQVSFYQYSDCSEPEKVDNAIYLAIYDAASLKEYTVDFVGMTSLNREQKSDFGPCFQNPPVICYLVAEYTTTISMPKSDGGYVLSVQRCCRIAGIANVPNSNVTGLTYTITIPGGNASNNNSPVFEFNDANAICVSSPFSFDFSAKDIDGDSLVYSLCNGLTGGTQFDPVVENPGPPPYLSIPYISPYNGQLPLGPDASINSKTGIFSGIAPSKLGTYVAAVCVDEYRKGVFISHTRKELHLDVSNCKIGGAALDSFYMACDSYSFTFANKAGENPDYSYYWDFGVTGVTTDTSTLTHPTFTYPDTGVFHVKLKAKNNVGCQDSAKTEVRVYPGFMADFSVLGSCIKNPYTFTDLTTTKYGYVNSWSWFFSETGTIADTVQNPFYTFADTGQKNITLIATNSKGCIDTAQKILSVSYGPDLHLNFPDTLICSIDTLQLKSSSSVPGAVFNWSPSYNIMNENTNQPFVYPKTTTTYNVSVSYKGCVTNDSVKVHVIDDVSLIMPHDTTICATDNVQLAPSTNGLYFIWSPPDGLSNVKLANPLAAPLTSTDYKVIVSVGKCVATDDVHINVVPYPSANAGNDIALCFGRTAQLNAAISGSSFYWTPTTGLLNPNSLSTVVGPQETTQYVLHVMDTLGCPKPSTDSILVKVIPKVKAFAGNDTTVVREQSLQLNATGGTNYQWTPVFNLTNPNIANPVLTFLEAPDTLLYSVKVSTSEGCSAIDSIKIYVFETEPQVFVPTAFTPNGDGRNDVYRTTVAGMKQFLYFRVYNRWGQLLFSTSEPNKGWDGTYDGKKQESGTYVYSIQAIDYNNKSYFKKGTFVLIR